MTLLAHEPLDLSPAHPAKDWSLMNRIYQKGLPVQDKPVLISQLFLLRLQASDLFIKGHAGDSNRRRFDQAAVANQGNGIPTGFTAYDLSTTL